MLKKTKKTEKEIDDILNGWWNYRIFEHRDEWTSNLTGNRYFNIHFVAREVYYKADGSIWSWTENEIGLTFADRTDLKDLFKHIMRATKKPVLRIEDDGKTIVETKLINKYTEKDLTNFDFEEEYGDEWNN